jgi:hypothetical protein
VALPSSSKLRSATSLPRAAQGQGTIVWFLLGFILLLAVGCATAHREPGTFSRPFEFGHDTFAYSNELFWVYDVHPETGKTFHHWREPSPDYAQHCYVVSRSARQFFQHAHFDPTLPATDEPTYRRLVQRVISLDPRHEFGTNKIVIPGFTNLHDFSYVFEDLLKAECGSMWQSYFQRGHWRMLLHFSEHHQRRTARELVESIRHNRPPLVHLAHFPRLQINHAILLYEARDTPEGWDFTVYDPNSSTQPAHLFFREAEGRFYFPPQSYFPGGIVDVYEIYCRWNY